MSEYISRSEFLSSIYKGKYFKNYFRKFPFNIFVKYTCKKLYDDK